MMRLFKKDMSDEGKQYKTYLELMKSGLKFPNEITYICMKVIVSIHLLSGKDEKHFKEILREMYYARKEMSSRTLEDLSGSRFGDDQV